MVLLPSVLQLTPVRCSEIIFFLCFVEGATEICFSHCVVCGAHIQAEGVLRSPTYSTNSRIEHLRITFSPQTDWITYTKQTRILTKTQHDNILAYYEPAFHNLWIVIATGLSFSECTGQWSIIRYHNISSTLLDPSWNSYFCFVFHCQEKFIFCKVNCNRRIAC